METYSGHISKLLSDTYLENFRKKMESSERARKSSLTNQNISKPVGEMVVGKCHGRGELAEFLHYMKCVV